MKSFFIVFLISVVSCSCTKEAVENTSAFEGMALHSQNNEPITKGYINITGYENTGFLEPDRKEFKSAYAINADGSFNFEITTPENVDYLIIEVAIPEFFTTTECNPVSCRGLKPGKDYSDLVLIATSIAN
jgi:hypothetical protein